MFTRKSPWRNWDRVGFSDQCKLVESATWKTVTFRHNGKMMSLIRALLILASLSGISNIGYADQTDPRLDALFDKLRVADSPETSAAVESDIWRIWLVAPNDEIQQLLDFGIDLMNAGQLGEALNVLDKIVSSAPDFAEGWNKRATVHYMLDNLEQSLSDIEITLKLEPNHFGALSGRGLVFIKLHDYENAIAAFEEVLKVGPQIKGARFNIDAIRKLIGQRDI